MRSRCIRWVNSRASRGNVAKPTVRGRPIELMATLRRPLRTRAPGIVLGLAAVLFAPTALAAEGDDEEKSGDRSAPTQAEVEAWLDSRAVAGSRDVEAIEEPPEAPPPPPPHRGIVVEASVGGIGHLGDLADVSGPAPWFLARVGFEVFDWAMVFAEGDTWFANTGRANPPPPKRAYAYFGFGGGLRFTVRPFERVNFHLQGSIGTARASNDVLFTYGFEDADSFNPWFGGQLGVEWQQVNPHMALTLHGGVRNYSNGLDRDRATATPLAITGGLAMRYAFGL